MKTYRFYKDENNEWFIDLPNFPFNKAWLQMVLGADKLLSKLADGKREIYLQVDRYPIPYGDGWLDRELKLGLMSGAIYNVRGVEIDHQMSDTECKSQLWLCPATLWVFLGYPKRLYYKVDNTRTMVNTPITDEQRFDNIKGALAFGH